MPTSSLRMPMVIALAAVLGVLHPFLTKGPAPFQALTTEQASALRGGDCYEFIVASCGAGLPIPCVFTPHVRLIDVTVPGTQPDWAVNCSNDPSYDCCDHYHTPGSCAER